MYQTRVTNLEIIYGIDTRNVYGFTNILVKVQFNDCFIFIKFYVPIEMEIYWYIEFL